MCPICNGTTYEELMDQYETAIVDHGFAIVAVADSPDRPGWLYTIGLHEIDQPELVLAGLDPPEAHLVIDAAARLILAGKRLADGDEVDVGPRHLHVGSVHRSRVRQGLLAFACEHARYHVDALQLVPCCVPGVPLYDRPEPATAPRLDRAERRRRARAAAKDASWRPFA